MEWGCLGGPPSGFESMWTRATSSFAPFLCDWVPFCYPPTCQEPNHLVALLTRQSRLRGLVEVHVIELLIVH